MKQNTWLKCNKNMFEFFGGSTVRITCDNLKTGVISHPREGDIILNEKYEDLGNHYLTAIMPAGVRKPKQKASVEGTVGKIATAIIAKLRNKTFHSLAELKLAVSLKLDDFNNAPFQKRKGSRFEVFNEVEKKHLKELPSVPYEIADWVYKHSVNFDCHVVYKTNRYSAPYKYVGKKVDLKVTDSLVEIYYKSERICSHKKSPIMLSTNGLLMKNICLISSIMLTGMIQELKNGHLLSVLVPAKSLIEFLPVFELKNKDTTHHSLY